MYVYICMCIYVDIYIYIHIFTYTYTYTYTGCWLSHPKKVSSSVELPHDDSLEKVQTTSRGPLLVRQMCVPIKNPSRLVIIELE